MRKLLAALLLLPALAGCAHRQGAYAGGSFSGGDCLESYDCYGGLNEPGYYGYIYGIQTPQSVARARVTKVERKTSTRVVTRSAIYPAVTNRSTSVRSAPNTTGAHTAPSSSASHSAGRR